MKEAVERSSTRPRVFEKKDWTRASKDFTAVLKMNPTTARPRSTVERCVDDKTKPPGRNLGRTLT